jgi:hypothetical protein
MRPSPRIRRLRSDLQAIEELRADSSILDFTAPGAMYGGPPESYVIRFYGRGLWRPDGSSEVLVRERHEMTINLGAGYPRMMPELSWKSPIFHPNISSGGVVCLGGYGTHWAPSVNLDELCTMLWDMIRYQNYDVNSPYNRDAANWAKTQQIFRMPVDERPLRDKRAGLAPADAHRRPPITDVPRPMQTAGVVFIDDVVIEAEVVEPSDTGVLFIE